MPLIKADDLDKGFEYETTFPFGKHKGERVKDVVESDPSYVVWFADNVTKVKLDPKLVEIARSDDRPQRRSGRRFGFDSYDDDDDFEDIEDMDD